MHIRVHTQSCLCECGDALTTAVRDCVRASVKRRGVLWALFGVAVAVLFFRRHGHLPYDIVTAFGARVITCSVVPVITAVIVSRVAFILAQTGYSH